MDSAEPGAFLIEATVATSIAIALVMLLRRPLRIGFGATIAYAAWLLVPAALLAVLLPAATAAAPVPMVLTFGGVISQATAADSVASMAQARAWMLAWTVGVLVTSGCFALQQWRFRRVLGALRERADGLQQANSTGGLPAAVGLLRPRIVVPADFDHRYSAEQRMLMHAHERAHVRGGDLQVNALVATLRCLFWFNPLVHLASRHIRHDQELACDQRVIARYPRSRRAYGEAMLKTQLAAQPLPLGCHWGYGHPLKERIEMLKQPVPTAARWIGGSTAVAVLTLAVAYGAWAAQPPRPVAPVVAVPLPEAPPAPDAPRPPPPPPLPEAPPPPPAPADPSVPPPPAPPAPPPAPPAPTHPALRAPPVYPAAAVEHKISGMVVLIIDIDPRGNPVGVKVERSDPAGVFDQAAVDAAWKWKFTPEVEAGKPVASRVRVPVQFAIPPGESGSAAAPASA